MCSAYRESFCVTLVAMAAGSGDGVHQHRRVCDVTAALDPFIRQMSALISKSFWASHFFTEFDVWLTPVLITSFRITSTIDRFLSIYRRHHHVSTILNQFLNLFFLREKEQYKLTKNYYFPLPETPAERLARIPLGFRCVDFPWDLNNNFRSQDPLILFHILNCKNNKNDFVDTPTWPKNHLKNNARNR